MRTGGLNWSMIFLLGVAGVPLVLRFLLLISDTIVILSVTVLFFLIVVIHGWQTLGAREVLVFFVIAYSLSLLYEYTDGLGFGGVVGCTCSYSMLLGLKFLGKIPYVIPLLWALFLYCTFTMTNILFNRISIQRTVEEKLSIKWFLNIVVIGIVTGLMMVSLDLLIDPVLVSMGAWRWSVSGSYYGIPLWNYEIWVELPVVIFVVFSVYLQLVKKPQMYIGGRSRSRYTLFVVVLYLAAVCIFGLYAVSEQMQSVIVWAAIPMGVFAVLVVIRFFRPSIN